MKNFVQDGDVVTVAAPYALSSGDGALVGSLFGVATTDAANGADVDLATRGVYDLAKTSAQAWSAGDKVYWDNSNKECTTVATAGQLIGVAVEAAANPSSTGTVRLNGGAPATAEGPQAAIADLTDNSSGTSGDDTIAAVSDVASAADAVATLAAKLNDVLGALRSAGIIATA